MKVKITHPFDEYQAGLVYELPEEKAIEAIRKEYAVELPEEKQAPKKAVKYGNR